MVNPNNIRPGELTEAAAKEYCQKRNLTGLHLDANGGWWAYHPGAALPVRVDPNVVWLEGLEEMNRDRK